MALPSLDWWIGPNSLLGWGPNAAAGALNTVGTAVGGALNTAGTAVGGAFNSLTGPVRQLGADLGGQGFWTQNASPEDTVAIQQQMATLGIDPNSVEGRGILDGLRSGRLNPADAFSQMEQIRSNQNLTNEHRAGMVGLDQVEKTYGGNLQARIDRLARLTSDPLALRSDPEYGAVLRNVENQANANVQEAARTSANQASARGTGFAGKSLSTVSQARNAGTLGLFNTLGQLHGEAQQSLDTNRDQQNQFVLGLEGARQNLRANTRTTPLDYSNPFANQLGIRGQNLQRQDAPINNALSLGSNLLGTGIQSGAQLAGAGAGLLRR